MKNIYVLGSICTDLVVNAPRLPKLGESLFGKNFFVAQGGKGANQAVAASRLGGNVLLCGAVGNDQFGNNSLKSLSNEKMDLRNVKIADSGSAIAMIMIAEKNNAIILDRGANLKVNISDVDKFLENANEGDIFLAQLEMNIEVVGYALKTAKEKGMVVVLNPAPMDINITKYLSYVDIITPNETETELFGGIEEIKKYVKVIIQTLGGNGYIIVKDNDICHYSCLKVDVKDTTGAGDVLSGGFVAYLSKGYSIEESARFGSVAASVSCTKFGAQPSIPYIDEVKKYL